MIEITSRDNQKLKFVRKIRDGKVVNLIFIEGLRLAEETLKSNINITEAFISKEFAEDQKNSQIIKKLSDQTEIYVVSEKIFKSISDTKNPQGIILICEKPEFEKDNFLQIENSENEIPVTILLHNINNPSNLGAIFRTAEAVGVKRIFISKNSANAFSPKALRASMGSVLRVAVWENIDFEEVLSKAKENKLTTICADINSDKNYTEVDWKKPRLLIFGSEAHGLTQTERKKIEESLFIPMEKTVESLNLAVACGVILFEAKRQNSN
ncbi:MAG: TrmH family RNA methyltransferase [Aridibacter sp.]